MAYVRTELGLVLKNVSGGPEKINVVDYLTRISPSPIEDCNFEKDDYLVNDQMGVFETIIRVNILGREL